MLDGYLNWAHKVVVELDHHSKQAIQEDNQGLVGNAWLPETNDKDDKMKDDLYGHKHSNRVEDHPSVEDAVCKEEQETDAAHTTIVKLIDRILVLSLQVLGFRYGLCCTVDDNK